jgi:monoamine oxidase
MSHTPLLKSLVSAVAVARAACQRQCPTSAILEAKAGHTRRAGALDRRRFLGQIGAGVAGTALAPSAIWSAHAAAGTPRAGRVAVVGAGLAGLTCAYRLRQAGIAATILEANTRLGGRCWTRRGDFLEGQLAEHGGELIDQSHGTIRQLAQELGLPLDNLLRTEAAGTEPFFNFDGLNYTFAEATDDLKKIWRKMHRDLSEASYPTLYHQFTERGWELDHLSIVDWINETVPGGMSSQLGQLLDVAYNIEYGGETDQQSALGVLYLLGYSGPGQLRIFGPSNEKYHVRGGNDLLVQRLAAPLQSQLVTGAALVAVGQTPAGAWALTWEIGGRTETRTFDHVVLALPFSILNLSVDLRQAGFSPLKMTAIRELPMGTNSKMNLQFRGRPWRALGCNGESYSDRGYQASWEVSRGQPGKSGILVNYTGGLIGASFGSGTPQERAGQFLTQIEPVLPGVTASWNGRATIDYWPGDPLVRGSYSFWKVGQYTRFAGVESERQGNCHFAGEHTSIDAQGYLEGAVESGERAAAEILER